MASATVHDYRIQMGTCQMIDLTGQRFGRLAVTGRAPSRGGDTYWYCACDCGTTMKVVRGKDLRKGAVQSCRCLFKELLSARSTTHGQSRRGHRSPEYTSWAAMIQRCTNESADDFRNYGGRGIGVCERWRSFEPFLADMGRRPSPHHSIDRIDNAGNYEPSNCRWATMREQALNRRNNRDVEVDGVRMPIKSWCEATGITRSALSQRIGKLGWSPRRAVTQPVRPMRPRRARNA